jgi:putative transposase
LYLSADALTMKVRESGRVVKTPVLLTCGINDERFREILGMQVATASVHGVADRVLLPT